MKCTKDGGQCGQGGLCDECKHGCSADKPADTDLYLKSLPEFDRWWYEEGSAPPLPGHDCEEHTKRMCEIAWSIGAYKAATNAKLESSMNAERVWETTMKAAIGEDGPASVSKAIADLKQLLTDIKAWDVEEASRYTMQNGFRPTFMLPLELRSRIAKALGVQ